MTKVGIKGNLHYNSDGNNKDSLSNRFRRKRMKVFEEFFESTFADELKSGKTIRILDIGGRNRYWNSVGFKYISNCEFTLLNLKAAELDNTGDRRFSNKIGDATDMKDIADNSYDLVFSNSCIEHVGKKPQWEKMRNEMLRTGRYYFLQCNLRLQDIASSTRVLWYNSSITFLKEERAGVAGLSSRVSG